MSHHRCSDDTSILKVATGVVLGIWAAKIIPILIVGVIALMIWLLVLLFGALARTLNAMGEAIRSFDRWIARRYSPRAAMVFWVAVVCIVVGGLSLLAALPPTGNAANLARTGVAPTAAR